MKYGIRGIGIVSTMKRLNEGNEFEFNNMVEFGFNGVGSRYLKSLLTQQKYFFVSNI